MSAAARLHRGRGKAADGGFALIAAIFLLVVLGLLGGLMVSMSTTQQLNSARDILTSRAYFAARAGMEWGVYQVLQNTGTCDPSTTLPALGGSAAGFSVVVVCTKTALLNEAGSDFRVYQLTSTATRGTVGAVDYADRQLTAIVSAP